MTRLPGGPLVQKPLTVRLVENATKIKVEVPSYIHIRMNGNGKMYFRLFGINWIEHEEGVFYQQVL